MCVFHSCVCGDAIYIFPWSVYLFCCRKYADQFWEYINRSQTHECGNRDLGRPIPFLGINKWDFRCSAGPCYFVLLLPLVLSSCASYFPFILSFLLFFRHLFSLVLSSSASSCPFIVCFFLSFHPLFLHVLSPPLSRPCPLISWFILPFHFLLLLVLSSSGFSCPFILCFSCSFISAFIVLSSFTFLVLSSLLLLSFFPLLLVVLSSSASPYTFCSDSPSPFIFIFFFVLYSALLHLPPLRFHCADGCWDRTQDRCSWCIDSQTL